MIIQNLIIQRVKTTVFTFDFARNKERRIIFIGRRNEPSRRGEQLYNLNLSSNFGGPISLICFFISRNRNRSAICCEYGPVIDLTGEFSFERNILIMRTNRAGFTSFNDTLMIA